MSRHLNSDEITKEVTLDGEDKRPRAEPGVPLLLRERIVGAKAIVVVL